MNQTSEQQKYRISKISNNQYMSLLN